MIIKQITKLSIIQKESLKFVPSKGHSFDEDDEEQLMRDDNDEILDDIDIEAEIFEDKLTDDTTRPRTLTRKEAIDILQTTRNFSGMDFRKANLAKLDFSNCNFETSNLSYANFKDSNLEGCNFANASLWNANLEGANLTRSNLEDTDLDYTKLRGAVLYRANVRRATLPIDLIPRDEIMRSVNEGTKVSR